jgi:hypothetical protein
MRNDDSPRVRALATPEHPGRAIVTTFTAHAVFRDAEHAALFLKHPGDLPRMARAYLAQL